jgi:hypothetical protein
MWSKVRFSQQDSKRSVFHGNDEAAAKMDEGAGQRAYSQDHRDHPKTPARK